MVGERNSAESTQKKGNWRGRKTSGKVVRHRWQQADSKSLGTRSSRLRYGLRSALWLTALLGLAFAFMFLMKFSPRQTPVLAFVATEYEMPFLPNSWAFEDLEAIKQLDGDTILLFDADDTQAGREALIGEFDRLINNAAQALKSKEPLIVYLSMHADVNDEGEPCLIPAGVSAFNSNTWVAFPELFEIANKRRDVPDRPLLFVVDCHRHRPNWHRGETSNPFVSALKETVRKSDVANLTVMTSCATGEQSHIAKTKSQTAFGYFFVQGLSGAADKSSTGNNDNYVSFVELTNYVSQDVAGFANTAFGTSQQVQTFTTSPKGKLRDFVVCWVSTRKSPTIRNAAVTRTPVDLAEPWKLYESFPDKLPFQSQPIVWGDVENELVRLEMLAAGGERYGTPATLSSVKIQEQMRQIQAAIKTVEPSKNEKQLRKQLDSLQGIRDQTKFSNAVAEIPASPLSQRSVEFQLASHISAQSGSSLWDRPEQVSEALQVRALAESTVADMSSEAIPWVASLLEDADEARRKAEDQLFAGQPATESFQLAKANYNKAAARARETQDAIDIYNRANAEIFWFARWAAQNSPQQSTNDSIDDQAVEALIQKTKQLGHALNNCSQTFREADVLTFGDVAKDVSGYLSKMQQQLNQEYGQLLSNVEATPEYIHRARSLLGIVRLPTSSDLGTGWEQREHLARLLEEQIKRRLENRDLVETVNSQNTTSEGPVARVQLLPLLVSALKDDASDVTPSGRSALKQRINVRASVRAITKQADDALNSTDNTVAGYRNGLLVAAGHQRIAAAISKPRQSVNAVAAQQDLDERLRQLFLCERTINDFYGPVGQNSVPFFSKAADDYLLEFQTSLSESVALQAKLLSVNDLLNKRINAASDGLTVSAQDVLLMDGMQLDPVEVSIKKSNKVADDSFPPTTGSLYFATSNGTALSDAKAAPLADIMADNFNAQLTMRPSISDAMSGEVFAVTNIRGNLFKEPVLVTSAGGQETQQEIRKSSNATVSVDGTTAAANSVVVIFDCSQSMAAPIPAEGPGNQQTRFQATKGALYTLLQKLADQQNTRVGLTFFGHRVGWNPKNREQLLVQDQYLQGIAAGLKPFEDVESLLPVGRFDTGVLQTVKPLIDSTKPWGETPLYLAVTEAISELQGEDKLRSRRIIVMTDGANHQVNPIPSQRRTINDVLQALPAGVRVDIVGIDIPDADAQQAQAEFEAIASHTEGQFIPVDDVTELVQSLTGLVESEDFEVAMSTGEVTVSTPGQKISLQITEQPLHATVIMGDAKEEIVISGGESVQLQLSDDKRRLFVPRWLQGNPQFVALGSGSPFAKSAIECGIQKVQLADGVAIFEFSLQHATRQFIAKPPSVQVSAFPTDQSGNRVGVEYRADIDSFQSGTPVPAFQLKAMNWPVNATHAELNVFVQADEADAIDRIQLATLESVGEAHSTHRDIEGVNGVHAYVVADTQKRNTLTIVEKHQDGSPGLGELVISLRCANSPVRKIQRIDQQNSVVATIFEFDSARSIDLANDVVEFILSSEMQLQSLRMMKPVVLPVSANSGLLIPTN